MIADKLKPIKGQYYKATEQLELLDLENRISEAKDVILIAIDGQESEFTWPKSDSLIENPQYIFLVLESTNSSDFLTVLEAQKECKALAKEIGRAHV